MSPPRPRRRRPKGLGTITQLPSGSYRARIWIDDRRHQHVCQSYGEANDWLELKLQEKSGAPTKRKGTRRSAKISELLDEFTEARAADGLQEKSVDGLRSHLERVVADVGDLVVGQLDGRRLTRLGRDLRTGGKSPSTVRNRLSALTSLVRYAMGEGYIGEAALIVKRPKPDQDSRPPAYSEEDVAALLEVASSLKDPRYVAAIQLKNLAGLRPSEVLRCRTDDLNAKERALFVPEAKWGSSGTVPIPDALVEALLACKAARGTRFVGEEAWTTTHPLRAWLTPVWLLSDVDGGHPHPHRLRHTWATRLARTGATPFQLMQWGRWKTMSQVLRYFHGIPLGDRGAVDVMGSRSGHDRVTPGKKRRA